MPLPALFQARKGFLVDLLIFHEVDGWIVSSHERTLRGEGQGIRDQGT
jgi:hypothetical protein